MVTFSDRAREMVLSFLDGEEDGLEALRIQSTSESPVAPSYELTLVGAEDIAADDTRFDAGGFVVVVAPDSLPAVKGATVDFVERVNESGFEVRPASNGAGASAGASDSSATATREPPTGELADRIRAVLDERINPAVAMHGGAIVLDRVEGTEIYIEMTGGCQGCAMSRLTLRQGVERMLQDEVPEITAVHDATDHASGDNPYFTQEV